MSILGGLTTGMAYLPNWLTESRDGSKLETLLSGWCRASGWKKAGFLLPKDGNSRYVLEVRPESAEHLSSAHPEIPDITKSLRAGSSTVNWQLPNSSGRLYCLIHPQGRSQGLIWAERSASDPWTDADRNYLKLSARLIERSPILNQEFGACVDSERLAQRIADSSLIAGRMAHDFDNILTGIIGFADLSIPLLPSGSQPAKYIAEISKVGQRGIVFTQQLHQLSRAGQSKPTPGSVLTAAQKEEARLKSTVAAGVEITINVPANLTAVAIDAAPLGVVIGNLLENAIDAMTSPGKITINARAIELSAQEALTYLGRACSGPAVEIVVTDTGTGIKPEVRSKLFVEPFFTTKVRRRGLGLAIVYRVVSAHHGGVRIDTATHPESGTVARVVLPQAVARPVVMPAVYANTSGIGG